MRRIESHAFADYGIPSILLMENAAFAVVQEICKHAAGLERESASWRVSVVVGKGNNGGDGMAVARLLSMRGMDVTVLILAQPADFRGDALINFRLLQETKCKLFVIEGEKHLRLLRLALSQADVIVDAIYGIGLRGALPNLIAECVKEINAAAAWVVAVDIPSGLEADRGIVRHEAVRADQTVTFGWPKLGHLLARGPEYCGALTVDPISIPDKYLMDEELNVEVLTERGMRALLPQRSFQGHKGTHGRGILAAGSTGMSGAALLAGRGALRAGAGLLQMVVPQGIAAAVDAGLTEATVWPAPGEDSLTEDAWPVIEERCRGAQALAVGPGLKQDPALRVLLEHILEKVTLPLVLDADALNVIAVEPDLLQLRRGRGPLILTPHPGEMARLCGISTREVQANRLDLAVSKAIDWEATVVLKGAITIIAAPDGQAFLNPTGNPGLGTGGTGDVLTGSILGWLAQGVAPLEAACLSVYLHGLAADDLARSCGFSGYTASEVADRLPEVREKLRTQ
jgi:NAD(P)H-hydrate epimerase